MTKILFTVASHTKTRLTKFLTTGNLGLESLRAMAATDISLSHFEHELKNGEKKGGEVKFVFFSTIKISSLLVLSNNIKAFYEVPIQIRC